MKHFIQAALLGALLLTAAPLAFADGITGEMGFTGSDTVTHPILRTTITYGSQKLDVGTATGILSAFGKGATVVFTPQTFSFIDLVKKQLSGVTLFTIETITGKDYTFDPTEVFLTNGGNTIEFLGVLSGPHGSADAIFLSPSSSRAAGVDGILETLSPEPSSLMLMLTGVLAMAALGYSRRRVGIV